MAGIVNKIRKVQVSKVADFDDQLWPINCAILILAGFVAGIVVATSDFGDPRILYNAGFRLFTVALTVAAAFWAIFRLQGRFRRRILFCVVVSLLVHVWLGMYAATEYLALLAEQETESAQQVADHYDEITIPDYHFDQPEEPETQQSFQEPIETEAPKPAEPEAVKREASEPEMPTDVEPPDEPEIPQRQQPNPAVTRRAELSAPRRADAAAGAQISRQEWRHRPRPNEPIPEEEIGPPARRTAAAASARIAPHQQRPTNVRIEQRQTFEDLSSTRTEPPQVRMARRATGSQPIPDVPTTPAPTRQVRRPADVPRTEAAAPEPVEVAQRSQQLAVQPAGRMIARRDADTPTFVRQAAAPTPTPMAPSAVPHVAAQPRRIAQPPRLAQARQPVPLRWPRDTELPTDAMAPQAEPVAAARPLDPAEVSPTRARMLGGATGSGSGAALSVAQPAANGPLGIAPGAVAQGATRRAQRPTQPSPQPSASRPARIARSQEAPQIAAAGIQQVAVNAGATRSTQPSLPTVRPMTTSVGRTADRLTQVPQDQPAGRSLPAMTRTEQLPSAMAPRRANAWQQGPAGADATPARPSSLARSGQGADLPSTAVAVQAEPASIPASTGGTPASRLRQASSAAVRRTAANPRGGGSGAAGIADFAVGSTQIVARSGQPRGTGFGQPSATANAATPRIARAAGPAPSVAASGIAEAGPAASGAVASTAQGPSTPSFNIRGSAARRGGTVDELASETAVGSGPAGSSGTPGPVGVAAASRVTRYESIDSAIAGSGTPRPGRTAGGALSPNATAAAADLAAGAPSGGTASQAPPLQAQVSGPRRQVSGLPGGLESQPAAGAPASFTAEGAPLASAVARRATAAGGQAGGRDLGAPESVTLRSSRGGTDLPAAAVPVEDVPQTGAGGAAVAQGGLPSSLPIGTGATVRRAAADVSIGQTTAASGTAESGIGSALAVALAGRARSTGEGVPAPAASAAAPAASRSAATGPGVATPGPIGEQPAAQAVAGGPAAESPGPAQPAGGAPAAAVARGAGGVRAAQPGEAAGSPGTPQGGAIAVAPSNRADRDDTVMALASAGAVAGPDRTTGALRASGTALAAPELAQAGPSTGGMDAAPQGPAEATLAAPQRQMAGLPGSLIDRIAIEAAVEAGPTATTPGTARGQRRLPPGNDQGLAVAAEVGRGPLRRTDAPGLPRGVAEAIEDQPIASAAAESGREIEVAEGAGLDEPSRREGGLPVQIAAMAGPGGLGYDPSPEVGLPSRRARPESEIIHTVSRRFVIERSGGELAIDGRARYQPTEAFRQRDVGRRAQVAQAFGGSEGTEKAVEIGLDYFARHQFPDGHWSLHELPPGVEYDDPGLGEMKADTAATGLALLTYLGAGYTHLDDKHRAVVSRGVDWLARNQKPNGDLFTGGTKFAWFYSHGIATIALCEAYGMTQDPELREPARKAIDFICKTQNPTKGGWRYSLDSKGRATETDTSVSGWMLMALKSAQMAGLEVPEETLKKVDDWLNTAQTPSLQGRYVYNPFASSTREQLAGRKPNLAMTSEAMLMRMYLGRGRDDAGLIAGADYLKENLPAVGTQDRPLRDCYYWYYATQAMFQMQKDYWTAWNDRLRPLAESSQVQFGEAAGSWHPARPVRDRWSREGGRHYVTALHLLVLEVYYRHLPLFQELSR